MTDGFLVGGAVGLNVRTDVRSLWTLRDTRSNGMRGHANVGISHGCRRGEMWGKRLERMVDIYQSLREGILMGSIDRGCPP